MILIDNFTQEHFFPSIVGAKEMGHASYLETSEGFLINIK